MPLYSYKAKNNQGETITGTVEAQDLERAASLVSEQGLSILTVNLKKAVSITKRGISIPFLDRIKVKDIVIFSRQLSIMISANVPILQALRLVAKQTTKVKFSSIISEVADDVDGGMKFSEALTKHRAIFGDFYINMVKSGEASGKFDEVLNYLADQQEKDYDLRSKIRGALIYPTFIFTALLVMGFLVMVFIIPRITSILKEANIDLPITTKLLIGTSDFLKNFWFIVVILIIGAIVGLRLFKKTPYGKNLFDNLFIRIPKFGTALIQKVYLVRLTRTLSTLIVGGVPLPRAIAITSEVIGNKVYKKILEDTVKEVEDGNSLATVFSKSPFIPQILSQMIVIGEQTGRVDLALERMSAFYNRELDHLIAGLTALLEPFILFFIGGAVGFIVLSIMVPLFKLSEAGG